MSKREKENRGNEVKIWSKNIPGKDMFALGKVLFMHNVDESHWSCAVNFMEEKRIKYLDEKRSVMAMNIQLV